MMDNDTSFNACDDLKTAFFLALNNTAKPNACESSDSEQDSSSEVIIFKLRQNVGASMGAAAIYYRSGQWDNIDVLAELYASARKKLKE